MNIKLVCFFISCFNQYTSNVLHGLSLIGLHTYMSSDCTVMVNEEWL